MTSLETAQYDVITILKKVKEHLKTAKQQIIDVCNIYAEQGDIPKEKIGERVYEDCRGLDYSEEQIDYVKKCVPSEFKDHKFDKLGQPEWSLDFLTSINQTISNERVLELLNSTNDSIPLLAQYKLTHEQLEMVKCH